MFAAVGDRDAPGILVTWIQQDVEGLGNDRRRDDRQLDAFRAAVSGRLFRVVKASLSPVARNLNSYRGHSHAKTAPVTAP